LPSVSAQVPLIPRRWSATVDGICWLPRMVDKARMYASGTLGNYLMGHSPVDRELLSRLEIKTDEFVKLANAMPSDLAVLDALRRRGFDEARVRRWSAQFEKHHRLLIPVWDLDEGRIAATGVRAPLLALMKRIEKPVIAVMRKVSPLP